MRRAQGFTLIEVLIAVGIFALIGLVSAALLSRTIDARALTEARADRLQDLQRAFTRIERDLLQYSARAIRDQYGDPQPPLLLALDAGLELTSQGWRNPLQLARSELQRINWRLNDEGVLERRFWVVLDRAQDSESVSQGVLEEVQSFDVEIIDDQGGSHRAWPLEDYRGEAPVPLPGDTIAADADSDEGATAIAIRFAIEAAPFGRIERLVAIGEAIDLGADAMEVDEGAEEDSDADATPEGEVAPAAGPDA